MTHRVQRSLVVSLLSLAGLGLAAPANAAPADRLWLSVLSWRSALLESGQQGDLLEAGEDAVYSVLREHGEFRRTGLPWHSRADRRDIAQVANGLAKSAANDLSELIVVYWAGTGDENQIRPSGKTTMNTEQLAAAIGKLPARHRILIEDVCRANTHASKPTTLRTFVASGTLVVQVVADGEDRFADAESGSSRLAQALAGALRGAADRDRDGQVTLGESLVQVAHDLGTSFDPASSGAYASLPLTYIGGEQVRVRLLPGAEQAYKIRGLWGGPPLAVTWTRRAEPVDIVVPAGYYAVVRSTQDAGAAVAAPFYGTSEVDPERDVRRVDPSRPYKLRPHLLSAGWSWGMVVRWTSSYGKMRGATGQGVNARYGYALGNTAYLHGGAWYRNYDSWDGPTDYEKWLGGEIGVLGSMAPGASSPVRGLFAGSLQAGGLVGRKASLAREGSFQAGTHIDLGLQIALGGWTFFQMAIYGSQLLGTGINLELGLSASVVSGGF